MNRNIGMCLVFCILTCGLYSLYWIYVITEDAIHTNSSEWSTSGGMTLLLMFVTFGLFTIFWSYKMGKVFEQANGGRDNSILYLILKLLGLNIISLCIIQDDINKYL